MINALTIDVEDYFHVTAFAGQIKPAEWDQCPLRVGENTRRILDLLDRHGLKATFFILGWVAERLPQLVREIESRGHEIACHGYGHQLVYNLGPRQFRSDVKKARTILEDITGNPIRGFRAPSYSITRNSLWAFDVLIEEGFDYDSSIFPIFHDIYGIPGAERFPHEIKREAGIIKEFPISTLHLELFKMKYRLPIAGGGYLRLFPAPIIGRAMKHVNAWEKRPVVLYFHPWEIDPDQPRINAGFKSRFRHYLNLEKTQQKLNYLMGHLRFGPMGVVLGEPLSVQ